MARSWLISADMAHSVHPNYADIHEAKHRPIVNGGVVIKTNANVRYATTAETSTMLKTIARKHAVPIQEFVVRNDSSCGSTIGPILAARLGLRTIDIGCPQLSMHSIRETAGTVDIAHAINLFKGVFSEYMAAENSFRID
ncbi:aspartyl aminopeptidase [Ramicandelaber brevisporus]|nr:aspartyl aminopeptidase [Ramicandelaber brevisporus]